MAFRTKEQELASDVASTSACSESIAPRQPRIAVVGPLARKTTEFRGATLEVNVRVLRQGETESDGLRSAILGMGGANLKQICDSTGARVRLCGSGKDMYFAITSRTQASLDSARRLAADLVEHVSEVRGPIKVDHVLKVDVRILREGEAELEGMRGAIIGKGGANVKKICDSTGARVWLKGSGQDMHIAITSRTHASLESARRLADNLVDEVRALVSSRQRPLKLNSYSRSMANKPDDQLSGESR